MVLDILTSISYTTVIGMAILGGIAGAVTGFLHRMYMNQRVPFYAPIIVGLGAIGLWLNGSAALIAFAEGIKEAAATEATAEPVVITQIETNILAAFVGLFAAYGGGRVGDVLAPNVSALMGAQTVDREVSKIVRSIGRVSTITVPDTIGDIDGYETVNDETKTQLAGTEFVFPRGLTVDQIRERIAKRAREDYGIAHVDVELDVDGSVTHFSVGGRVAGIGPTLPPRKVALGVKTNPPPKASPGDIVTLWDVPGEEAEPSADHSAGEAELPPIFAQYTDHWYRPDSDKYDFAIRTPDGDRRYTNSPDRAANLLREWYGPIESDETAAQAGTENADTEDAPPKPRRVATGELRATNGDIATVTLDVGRVDALDQSKTYRLTTLKSVKNPERVFASLLRSANETLGSIHIATAGGLDGQPVGALSTTVLAVRTADRRIETIPPRDYVLRGGEVLYAVGDPSELRKLDELNGISRKASN